MNISFFKIPLYKLAEFVVALQEKIAFKDLKIIWCTLFLIPGSATLLSGNISTKIPL